MQLSVQRDEGALGRGAVRSRAIDRSSCRHCGRLVGYMWSAGWFTGADQLVIPVETALLKVVVDMVPCSEV